MFEKVYNLYTFRSAYVKNIIFFDTNEKNMLLLSFYFLEIRVILSTGNLNM